MVKTKHPNDLYDNLDESERDDKLVMVYLNNKENNIAVNTAFGLSERTEINNILTQGSVWGPLSCSSQVDTIGKESVSRGTNLYRYKKLVNVMQLAMVDDLLDVKECGMESVASNVFVVKKLEMCRLKFGKKKCHKFHVGKKCQFCPVLQVHGEDIDIVSQDKYLGDIVSETIQADGSNSKNVAARKGASIGITSQIMTILSTVNLGSYYFETAVLLRDTMLISGTLFNTEVWYSLTQAQVEELGDSDKGLLRRILHTEISLSLIHI